MNPTKGNPAAQAMTRVLQSLSGKSDDDADLFARALSIALAAPVEQLSDVISWHAHVPFAQALVAIAKPRTFVELGVHKGDSFLSVADAMQRYGVDGRAFAVDTWAGDDHAGRYAGDRVLDDLTARAQPFVSHTTFLRKTFDEALADFKDGEVDLLHIDGYHTYDAVEHDFETWRPKLSPSAIVLFHDTNVFTGDFGVHRFWDEVRSLGASCNFKFGNGLGVLCVGSNINEQAKRLVQLLDRDDGQNPYAALMAAVGEAFLNRQAMGVYQHRLETVEEELTQTRTAGWHEIARLNQEMEKDRSAATGEIARLNQEIEKDRSAAMGEIERLNREMDKNGAAAASEIQRLNMQLVAQSERLGNSRELARLGMNLRENDRQTTRSEYERKLLVADRAVEELQEELRRVRLDVKRKTQELKAQINDLRSRAPRARIQRLAARALKMVGLQHGVRTAMRNVARTHGRRVLIALPVRPETRARLTGWLLRAFSRVLGLQPLPRREFTGVNIGLSLPTISERYLSLSREATGVPEGVPERSVSIIVPVFNKLDYTLRCIEAIHRNSTELEYEVIVVDDCSVDETEAVLSGRADIHYIRNASNLGFIGSCNAALAVASKNYVCFLNNDTEVAPYWLSALVNTFELHNHVGIVGSKLIYPDGRLQEAGGIIWDDFSGWNWGRLGDRDEPLYNYARQVDYCSGASLIVPRALALALGGFEPQLSPAYGEDSDLAFKVRSLGLRVMYQPISQVIHYEGVSSGTDITRGVKAFQVVNAEKLAKRWAPVLPFQGANGREPSLAADRGCIGRILVLDQITPEPDHDAGSLTSLEIMRTLRDLGYKVTFIPCSNFVHVPNYSDMLAAMGIESVLYPWTRTVAQYLDERGKHTDAVLIFRNNTASDYLDVVRQKLPRAKIIFHTSDLQFLRDGREAALHGRDQSKRIDATRQRELGHIGRSDLTIVHSYHEQQLLADLAPMTPTVVFPWIYESRAENGLSFSERAGMVFLGGYRHEPNADAVRYFVASIWPIVRNTLTDAVFRIAGSHPPPDFDSLSASDVVIEGFVENLSPMLWKARIMVVPLRYGAGLKGKIITALAHGLPVVTTSIGAEGMALRDGLEVLVADTPDEFAAAVNRLYSDEALWRSMSKSGVEFVKRHTSREAGVAIIRDVLDKLGLPYLDSRSTNKEVSLGQFGTPAKITSLDSLLAAAVGNEVVEQGILVVPSNCDLDTPGWQVIYPGEVKPSATRVVAVLDSTDDEAVKRCIDTLRMLTHKKGRATLVFVPPRLIVRSGEYLAVRPFSDEPASGAGEPLNERYSKLLAQLGGALDWTTTTQLTGTPGIMLANWRPIPR